ncbi:uncharacterized protein BP5553_06163 [Venustampulla echinocandica]|uniref:Hcy-binding domain-containing protein n=1 Tax=Venustampulla echinocandica TaxID=2656787 RepID=A0A370TMS2_9HELO|nr:uncharacterized protein BP5553_06163 [Venustampulla echinocandica]RDL36811.1 hypothetical protein BP5553_06163 [Venustampulla echinocandica]
MPPQPMQIHLLDGALGTLLSSHYNLHYTSSTPLWSSNLLISPADRNILRDAHSRYARAGAEILLSATYQASFEGFAKSQRDTCSEEVERGIGEDDARRLMRGAVGVARDAFECAGGLEGRAYIKGKGKVALSLGPYGACMIPSTEYSGVYDSSHQSVGALRDWHLQRLGAFCPFLRGAEDSESDSSGEKGDKIDCWNDVDMVAFETLPVRKEILAVRESMSCVADGSERKPFWISCVFPGEEFTLPDGSDVRQVVEAMLGMEREDEDNNDDGELQRQLAVPMGIGINCTRVDKIEKLILDMEDAVKGVIRNENEKWPALVVYPDGTMGEVYNTTTKEWEKVEAAVESEVPWEEAVFSIVKRTRERGMWKAIVVGGCCKTTPDDIAILRKRIDGLSTT